ncbi:hypothetical protein P4U90_19835 [Cytobacillus kochii]|nr:hypothetical protein [Cytobacillus kochii]
MTSKKVQEAYDRLASDYEHNVDKHNIYNIYYERPAMINLIK